jgi:2-methylcitrate dehydratase PrpD
MNDRSIQRPDAVNTSTRPIASALADFACNLTYDVIPTHVRERAKHNILDAVGNAFASTHYDFAHRILSGIRSLGEEGRSAVIGMPVRLPLRDAVLMNGALVHGLDYDDTHIKAIIHPSASALPCALGVAEHVNANGRDFLAAYILGVEVATRISAAAKGGFHRIGFHPTGLVAHFSCALIAGRLLKLNASQLTMAQGVVGSTAAASHEFRETGAWNKRLHPGWAGVGGITAATLAHSGFVAPDTVYEGRFGLFKSHLGSLESGVSYGTITEALGEKWETTEVAIKPFPVCHFIHACADAALAVLRDHAVKPANIVQVRALIPKETMHIIAEPLAAKLRPHSSYQAKFSVQFCIAACLVRGKLGLGELENDVLTDPEVLVLADKVKCEIDPDSAFPKYFSGGVTITTKDGSEFTHMEPINRGTGERALSEEEIVAKYMDNAALAVARDRAEALRDLILDCDQHNSRELAYALCGA